VASLPEFLNSPVGDCNDYAVVMAALGMAGHLPARWALGHNSQGVPNHIWTQLWDGSNWVDVDPTPGAPPPGEGSPVDVPGGEVLSFDILPVETFTRTPNQEDPSMSYPVNATMVGIGPSPYVGAAPLIAAAVANPAIMSAASALLPGAIGKAKGTATAVIKEIAGWIAENYAEPCARAVASWSAEYKALVGDLLGEANAASDPISKYALAGAVVEITNSPEWAARLGSKKRIDLTWPLGSKVCKWGGGNSLKISTLAQASAIMKSNEAAALGAVSSGQTADHSVGMQIPPWAWAVGGAALLLLLRR
jgi:hypothetical protein